MIAKTKCPECGKIHDVEFEINLDRRPDEMGTDDEWTKGIFKCIVLTPPLESNNDTSETPTIKDAKNAMRELERDFLNKIIAFETAYGVTIQYIETNLSGIPSWYRKKETRTNSVLMYGDL